MAFPSPPPSLTPPSARKRSLPFSLRIQTTAATPPPFALGGISSPAVAIPAQGITGTLSFEPPPPSAVEPSFTSFSCFPPPRPALAPLPLPPHLRGNSQPSPSGSSVPSLGPSPSSTPSTAMSSTSSSSLPALDPSRGPRSGGPSGRNAKRLSISTKPSWPTLQVNPAVNNAAAAAAERKRSNSVSLVLPYFGNTYSEEEEHDPPYPNGPVEILPRVWLGHEGHARDVKLLRERGIGWVLNVAKEVDLELGQDWHVVALDGDDMDVDGQTNGKLRYLKLPWSHGQQDLCEVGFNSAMHFVDRALSSGESVLIHCQCGVSRSATLVMALVIRAGHQARICGDDPEHPLCRIASHNDAYEYVQGKSRWVGPNIVLINQLVEYSKNLRTGAPPPEEALRSRTVSESTDLSQIAHEPLFSSSDSSASSSPGLASPPTPEGCVSPEMGPDSIEAMLLDKQMEAQYSKLCQQRAAAAAARAQEQQRQMQLQAEQVSPRGLGLPTAVQSPLSPASPLSASTGRPSRTRASSAESALASKTPWNIGMLLRVEEES